MMDSAVSMQCTNVTDGRADRDRHP